MAPVVVLPGVLAGPESKPLYAGILDEQRSIDPPDTTRFHPIPERGLGDKDDMYSQVEEDLLKTYDHLEQPYVLVGHSLGGYFAVKFAMQHPEVVASTICLAGAQEGIQKETLAVKALKSFIENVIGANSDYEHLLHDSETMVNFREMLKKSWPEHNSLELISSDRDPLFPLPYGLGVKLPKGQKPKTYILGKTTAQARQIENVPRHTIGFPSPRLVRSSGIVNPNGVISRLINNHISIPAHKSVIDHTKKVRAAAATLTSKSPDFAMAA